MDGGAAAALALLASLLGLIWGFASIFDPKFARTPSRWYSLPLSTSVLLFFGLAMIAFPETADGAEQDGNPRTAGLVFVAIWVFLAGISHLAAWQIRTARQDKVAAEPTPAPPPPPPPKAAKPVETPLPKIIPDRAGVPKAKAGKWIEFTYADEYGEVTDRHLRNWSRTSKYLEGFCTDRKAVRTFRIDRVIEWGDSE